MSGYKKGTRVLVEAVVVEECDTGPRVKFDDFEANYWISHDYLVPVDPDELKVGDRVRTAVGSDATVTEVVLGPVYSVELGGQSGISEVLRKREHLTKLPPKPKYTLERRDDILFVMGEGNEAARSVRLDDPDYVENAIERWANELGIDAHKARELVAEARVLKTITVGVFTFTATRQDCLWVARVSLPTRGVSHALAEAEAKRLFPDIGGPYWNEQ